MAAERVFGTINGVPGKIAAIEAAAEVAFRFWDVSEEDRATLKRLLAHYKAAAERRNDIAHAVVTHVSHDGKHCGVFLVPPYHATKKRDLIWDAIEKEGLDQLGGAYRCTSADIETIGAKLTQLWSWASGVWGALYAEVRSAAHEDGKVRRPAAGRSDYNRV